MHYINKLLIIIGILGFSSSAFAQPPTNTNGIRLFQADCTFRHLKNLSFNIHNPEPHNQGSSLMIIFNDPDAFNYNIHGNDQITVKENESKTAYIFTVHRFNRQNTEMKPVMITIAKAVTAGTANQHYGTISSDDGNTMLDGLSDELSCKLYFDHSNNQ